MVVSVSSELISRVDRFVFERRQKDDVSIFTDFVGFCQMSIRTFAIRRNAGFGLEYASAARPVFERGQKDDVSIFTDFVGFCQMSSAQSSFLGRDRAVGLGTCATCARVERSGDCHRQRREAGEGVPRSDAVAAGALPRRRAGASERADAERHLPPDVWLARRAVADPTGAGVGQVGADVARLAPPRRVAEARQAGARRRRAAARAEAAADALGRVAVQLALRHAPAR